MAAQPDPKAYADMDPIYEGRCNEHQTQANEEVAARRMGNQVVWMRPEEWAGNPFDFDKMHDPFSRDQSNQWMTQAFNSQAPGTTGDLVVCQTQIETLACMERAFRNRQTMRRPRAIAHMLSRKQGHGDEKRGFFAVNAIGYIQALNIQSRTKGK